MCFGQTVSAPNNPAPYALNNSQSAVNQTTTSAGPNGANALSPAAAVADQEDQQQAGTAASTPATGLGVM